MLWDGLLWDVKISRARHLWMQMGLWPQEAKRAKSILSRAESKPQWDQEELATTHYYYYDFFTHISPPPSPFHNVRTRFSHVRNVNSCTEVRSLIQLRWNPCSHYEESGFPLLLQGFVCSVPFIIDLLRCLTWNRLDGTVAHRRQTGDIQIVPCMYWCFTNP